MKAPAFFACPVFFLLIGLSPFLSATPSYSAKGDPVLIEVMSTSTCGADSALQDYLKTILQENDNLYILNCRTDMTAKEDGENAQNLNFCREKKREYFRQLDLFTARTPMIIVNGTLEATSNDVMTAVRASQSLQNVAKIHVEKNETALNINIPAVSDTDDDPEKIYVYTYLPTRDELLTIADPDLEITKEIMDKIQNNISVPFVTKKRIQPLMIRPVIKRQHVGTWNGQQLSMALPIRSLEPIGIDPETLSYLVLVQNENTGTVKAVGEYRSPEETKWLTSRNSSQEIKKLSLPEK